MTDGHMEGAEGFSDTVDETPKPKAKKAAPKKKKAAAKGTVKGTITKMGRGKVSTGKAVGDTFDWKDEIELPVATAKSLEARGFFEIDD